MKRPTSHAASIFRYNRMTYYKNRYQARLARLKDWQMLNAYADRDVAATDARSKHRLRDDCRRLELGLVIADLTAHTHVYRNASQGIRAPQMSNRLRNSNFRHLLTANL
jgi:hypothetical protein